MQANVLFVSCNEADLSKAEEELLNMCHVESRQQRIFVVILIKPHL